MGTRLLFDGTRSQYYGFGLVSFDSITLFKHALHYCVFIFVITGAVTISLLPFTQPTCSRTCVGTSLLELGVRTMISGEWSMYPTK